jgi:4'-phosphopantetheinyl transferase
MGEPITAHFVVTHVDKKPLNLWYAYPDDLLAEGVEEACAALLSEEERARAAKFKFARHARESLTSHALARTALSCYRPLPRQAWQFKSNAYGKPDIDPDCGLRFNLSNSVGLVVCLVAEEAEVGVDVESCGHAEKIVSLAPDVFSVPERTQLEALPGVEKLDRAMSLWTLKEAYIKARGMGLALPLDKFSFLFGGAEGIRLEIDPSLNDDPGRWRFCLLDRAGHRIALMVERKAAGELDVWEARPVFAPPARLSASVAQWFPRA